MSIHKVENAPSRILINRKQLLAMIPLANRTIYNMERRGEFPRRIALTSRNVAWDLAEVEEWNGLRIASAIKPSAPVGGSEMMIVAVIL